MKWMIASDLHGSVYYCEKLLEAIKREKPGRILLLGDILYHGPRNDLPKGYDPKAVTAALNPLKNQILCVRGNCDTEVDQMVLDFPILADYCVLDLGERAAIAAHGHHYSMESLPPMKAGDLFLQGHTHVPGHWVKDGILCLNPGSVSIPKEQSWHGYLMLDQKEAVWKDLDGIVKDQIGLESYTD